jgi:PTS system fructose-specific IIC component
MKILGVTACPTGIAHTYMAAEAIESAAKKAGYDAKVETRGSVGVENGLTDQDIAEAEFIILACDTTVPMDRFHGKKVLITGVSDAIKNAPSLIEKAKEAPQYSIDEPQIKVVKEKVEGEKKSFFGNLFKK